MKFGIVGLGRMGGNLALRAQEKGHEVVGYSKSEKAEPSVSPPGRGPRPAAKR